MVSVPQANLISCLIGSVLSCFYKSNFSCSLLWLEPAWRIERQSSLPEESSRKSEVRSGKSEVESRKLEIGSQKSGDPPRLS